LTTNKNKLNLDVILWGLASALLFCTFGAHAANASLTITPQKVILYDDSRSHDLHVVNRGQRTGVFEISWLDYVMDEAGGVQPWQASPRSPWSVQPYIRYSPRRITLKPGESQVLRVSLRRSTEQVANGEYFSHLRVITINDNLEETLRLQKMVQTRSSESSAGVAVSTKLAIGIPVLWRHSENPSSANIVVKQVDRLNNQLRLQIRRNGALSTRGYLHVFGEKNNQRYPLIKPAHFVIYANIEQRETVLLLKEPVPKDGRLLVLYSQSKDDVKNILGQVSVEF
jgi:fimbrial chaperone protein